MSETDIEVVKKRQRKKHYEDAIPPIVDERSHGGDKIEQIPLEDEYPVEEGKKE